MLPNGMGRNRRHPAVTVRTIVRSGTAGGRVTYRPVQYLPQGRRLLLRQQASWPMIIWFFISQHASFFEQVLPHGTYVCTIIMFSILDFLEPGRMCHLRIIYFILICVFFSFDFLASFRLLTAFLCSSCRPLLIFQKLLFSAFSASQLLR